MTQQDKVQTFSGDNMVRDSFNYLRDQRRQHQLSQTELARRIGMDRTFLSNAETSSKNPTIGTLKSIAEGLGLELQIEFKAKQTNFVLALDYATSIQIPGVIDIKPINIKVIENGKDATADYENKSENGIALMERKVSWDWQEIRKAELKVELELTYEANGKMITDTMEQIVLYQKAIV